MSKIPNLLSIREKVFGNAPGIPLDGARGPPLRERNT
jgi:hypothetical protein